MAFTGFRDGDAESRRWRFQEALRRFASTGDIRQLAEALGLIYSIVEAEAGSLASRLEALESRVAKIESKLDSLEAQVSEVARGVEELRDNLARLDEAVTDLGRRVSRVDLNVGGLAEAILSRFFIEHLKGLGWEIVSVERNARVDDSDVDLAVRAKRGGEEVVYFVEVKVKPSIRDVGGLLALVDLYESKAGVRPRPVLAGVWLGREVEAYARRRGVEVFRL